MLTPLERFSTARVAEKFLLMLLSERIGLRERL
jgi:hypothetical protein